MSLSAPHLISRHLSCVVCQEVFHDPTRVEPCGHVFCAECIKQWMRKNKSCPTCRTRVKRSAKDMLVSLLVGEVPVHCRWRKSGCAWKGQRQDWPSHQSRCTFNPSNMPDWVPEAQEMAVAGAEDLFDEAAEAADEDDKENGGVGGSSGPEGAAGGAVSLKMRLFLRARQEGEAAVDNLAAFMSELGNEGRGSSCDGGGEAKGGARRRKPRPSSSESKEDLDGESGSNSSSSSSSSSSASGRGADINMDQASHDLIQHLMREDEAALAAGSEAGAASTSAVDAGGRSSRTRRAQRRSTLQQTIDLLDSGEDDY